MFRKIHYKLKAIWLILTSTSAHVIFQKTNGSIPSSVGFGRSDLRDLVLYSKEIKNVYDGFLEMINNAAAESGDLHALQELRDAVDVLEKDSHNVGN